MSPLNRLVHAVIICSIGFLMPCAECEYFMSNLTTTQQSSSSSSDSSDNEFDVTTEVRCGEIQKMTDVCFKDLPPELMEFLTTTKIAVNKDEIVSKCTVFKRGMVCFDRYTERCLSKKNNFYLQNNVAGARKFLKKFCDDRKFQTEYNRHKECFSHIQEDWKKCTKDFQKILTDELHERSHPKNMTNKFMQFCCARHAYENCIYNSARFKCYKNSAKFARDTAKMLSEEKLFTNCRKFENLLCAAVGQHGNRYVLFLMVASLVAVIWRSDIHYN
ncbi:uncharacterized protein LOC129915835 [Episyrphus balteatus]|uniref:uncharacterized protein LOC129915835 n=1 Tax=Episyrphus balteatus TaxID=286459 RepID=UPI0024858433|nr:uncharacterized protein LOC129915835 [Episyrphus balteatus]